MSITRLLMWTAIGAALAAPAVCAAQATDTESAMVPYASRQSGPPPSDYGQPAYEQTPSSPGDDQPDAGRYEYPPTGYGSSDRDGSRAGAESRNWDERSGNGEAPDRGYASDRRDDDAYGAGSRFRALEQHIRDGLADGVRGDYLEPDDARDLLDQLRRIEQQEAREYRAHGPNLPADDEARLADELRQLDRRVAMIRDRP